jgi:hypothetical protein
MVINAVLLDIGLMKINIRVIDNKYLYVINNFIILIMDILIAK